MSLFSTIQIANNSLFASQIGLQVVGNNIANANTPGYIRQQAVFSPNQVQQLGDLTLGLGVSVQGIIQHTDRFLAERVRAATSDLNGAEAQTDALIQLEAVIGELSETDLSTTLNEFLASVNDVLNQPQDLSLRNLAGLKGDTLTSEIRRMDERVRELRFDINEEISALPQTINRLTEEIAQLNSQIVTAESGKGIANDAVGLRDQREIALRNLSEIIGIRAVEANNGSVTVFAGGDYLVFENSNRQVGISQSIDRGLTVSQMNIVDSDSPLASGSGRLAGQYAARDEVLGSYLDQLGNFTGTLINEFNRIFTQGQGLSGHTELQSEFSLTASDVALDQAGLPFPPVNGSFQVLIKNQSTGIVETNDVRVDLNGFDGDTTGASLVASLNGITGLSAALTATGEIVLRSDPNVEFAFANDTAGVLAAAGLGTFFAGSDARTVGINPLVAADPGKFAASRAGIGVDADNALQLAQFADLSLESQGGRSIADLYETLVGNVSQSAAVNQSVTEGFRVFHRTLEGEHLSLTGVNIDDEAVQMISHQRAYQASARLIGAVSELLEILVNL